MATKRLSSRQRGYTTKWEKESKAYLAEHPYCVVCGNQASLVDHIEPHQGDQRLFWSRSNWQPMCASCHGRKTVRTDGGFGREVNPAWSPRGACDETGAPLDRGHWWNNDTSELFLPRNLARSLPELTIISGSPASGKSHWVRQNAGAEDLVIDVDQIRREITGRADRTFSRVVTDQALEERNRRLGALATDREHPRAFFIVTAAKGAMRRDWAARLGARRSILVMTPRHVCLRRIQEDPARLAIKAAQEGAIERWFNAYSPWVGDTIIRERGD